MSDDDFPDWLPPAVQTATPDEQREILLGIHGQFELYSSALAAHVCEMFPGVDEFLDDVTQLDRRLTEVRVTMDRIEHDQQLRKFPRRTPMNRRIGEMEVFYEPPSPKHKLRVAGANGATRVRHNGWEYPFNSILPPEFARSAANFGAMMRSGRIRWSTDANPGPKPIKLTITPPKQNPKVEIITVSLDIVKNWKATFDHMVKLCDDNHAQAKDLLIADRDGNALYMKASGEYQRQQRVAGIPGGRVKHL
jgi:hypothetical protein